MPVKTMDEIKQKAQKLKDRYTCEVFERGHKSNYWEYLE